MLNQFFKFLGVKNDLSAADLQVEKLVRNMGGSIDRLSQKERRHLVKLISQSAEIQSMSSKDQLRDFLDNMPNTMDQMALLRKAGAFERGERAIDNNEAAILEVFRTGFAIPPALQTMLDEVLVSGMADHLKENLREALYFRPVMPPRETPGLTFCGGLPMAPKNLPWPRYTDSEGEQRPAHFIGQINCADIPDFGLRHLYPSDGILFFFHPIVSRGYTNLTGDLVVYLPASDDVGQIVPPASLAPYKHELGSYRHLWLHELAHPHLSPGSILPKWELEMGIGLHLDVDAFFQEDLFELSEEELEELEEAGFSDPYSVALDFAERMRKDPVIAFRHKGDTRLDPAVKADDGFSIGFNGFPHNLHAVHTLLGGYSSLLDDAKQTLEKYVAFVDGDPAPFYGKEDWKEPEHHQTRKEQSLAALDAIARQRREVEDAMKDVSARGLFTLTSAEDRYSFWQRWRSWSSEGTLKIECQMSDKWKPFLNDRVAMNGIVERAVKHCIIASACNGPESFNTLPAEVARNWMEATQAHYFSQWFRHQSMGYAPLCQGAEEERIYALPLMQFADIEFGDFQVADAGGLQYWIDLPDLLRRDFTKTRAVIGN